VARSYETTNITGIYPFAVVIRSNALENFPPHEVTCNADVSHMDWLQVSGRAHRVALPPCKTLPNAQFLAGASQDSVTDNRPFIKTLEPFLRVPPPSPTEELTAANSDFFEASVEELDTLALLGQIPQLGSALRPYIVRYI
jgi:hypothetical protein